MTQINLDPQAIRINEAWTQYNAGWGALKPDLKVLAALCAVADRLLKPEPKKALMEQLDFHKGEFSKLVQIGKNWSAIEEYATGQYTLDYEIATLTKEEREKAVTEGPLSKDQTPNGPKIRAFKARIRGKKEKGITDVIWLALKNENDDYKRDQERRFFDTLGQLSDELAWLKIEIKVAASLKPKHVPIKEQAQAFLDAFERLKSTAGVNAESALDQALKEYNKAVWEALRTLVVDAVSKSAEAQAKGFRPGDVGLASEPIKRTLLGSIGINLDELAAKAEAAVPVPTILAMLRKVKTESTKAETKPESTALDGFVAIAVEEIVGKVEPELPKAPRKPSAAKSAVAKAGKPKAKSGAQER